MNTFLYRPKGARASFSIREFFQLPAYYDANNSFWHKDFLQNLNKSAEKLSCEAEKQVKPLFVPLQRALWVIKLIHVVKVNCKGGMIIIINPNWFLLSVVLIHEIVQNSVALTKISAGESLCSIDCSKLSNQNVLTKS